MDKYKEKLKKIKIEKKIKGWSLLVVFAVVAASWIAGAFMGSAIFDFFNQRQSQTDEIDKPVEVQEKNLVSGDILKPSPILPDVANWKTYRSQKYEFEIKYPKDWPAPSEKYIANQEIGYDRKISFKSFDILVSNNKVNTETLKDKNDNSPKYTLASYQNSYSSNLNESRSCTAREMHIMRSKYYYKKVYIYHTSKDKYSYDIVPNRGNGGNNKYGYDSGLTSDETPSEMNGAVSTFRFKAADPIIYKPRIIIAVHVSCAGGPNETGSRSHTKGKHMDEDCCPDPDEWPKPGCAYSAKGYSVMLAGASKKK